MGRFLQGLFWLAVIAAALFWIVTSPQLFAAVYGRIYKFGGQADLDNGKTIFWVGGCASCHATPNQEDRTRLGGGAPLPSPFGKFYPPNISPHPRDGIGAWSVEDFARAMTQGVSPDGRHYYPAFPYASYERMAENDLRDLFAFIRTLPAVEGRTRDHDLPFPYNVRRTLGLWKWLYLAQDAVAVAAPSAGPERGKYLVEGPGHCAECHSPRNFLGGIVAGMRFTGGPDPEGKGTIPNITQHENGIRDYSAQDIATILSTGLKPDGDSVGGGMGLAVRSLSQAPKADVEAMANYVKSLPPAAGSR